MSEDPSLKQEELKNNIQSHTNSQQNLQIPQAHTDQQDNQHAEIHNQNKDQNSLQQNNHQQSLPKIQVSQSEDKNNDATPSSNSLTNNQNIQDQQAQDQEQEQEQNKPQQEGAPSKSSITDRNQSQKTIPKQEENPPQNPPSSGLGTQNKIASRASKKSQSSQSRPISHQNNPGQNQIIQDQQEQLDSVKPVNFDEVQSVIIKKNETGQVIKKVIQIVKIIRSSKKKPFLGGFKHATTEIVYHNSFSQTDQNRTQHKLQFTRQVQTYDYSSKSSKVPRQFGTQMEKEGLYVDVRTDKVIYPRIYFDSEMWLERRIEAALYIQRLTRGMFARKQTNLLKEEKYTKEMDKLNKQQEVRKKQEIKHKKQIERRRNPRTKQDFQILYEELENWRMTQIEKIKNNTSLTVDQRRKALKQTLDKETDLLQTIDRLKIIAAKDNKEHKIQKFLKAMSDPKKWTRKSDGRVTEVHTPFTVRAKELMDLYKGLKMKNVSTDERLDILLATKWTVKQWDCNLTREIVELIDREGSILDRGRPQSSLEGLRQRLANLFLQFIEYPLFNPEAARFQKIPYQIAEVGQQFH